MRIIVSTLDGEEVRISLKLLLQLVQMDDAGIEQCGYIAESVRDEYAVHFQVSSEKE